MRPKGSDVDNSIYKWAENELIQGPSRGYDIGKFFFTVSSGTLGLIIGLFKVYTTIKFDYICLLSILFYFISITFAINLVKPKIWKLTGDTDLYNEYIKHVKRLILNMWLWVITWLIATILGLYRLLK